MTVNVVYRRRAKWYYDGRLKPIRLLVVHDPEYPVVNGFARTLGDYFATVDRPASAHAGAGPDGVGRYVADGDTAFGAPKANADGLHCEIAGYARFTRAEWLEPTKGIPTLDNAADQFAEWCALHGIPPSVLTKAQVADGTSRGITDHRTVTAAFGTVGGHADAGPNFPMDVLVQKVRERLAPPTPPSGEDDMNYIVKYGSGQYVVAADLGHKTPIRSEADVDELLATKQYVRLDLSANQMAAIPNAS